MANKKILLVEDESLEAMDIKHTLEYLGFEVAYIASSGEEAVEKALEIVPDLILMDIVLKGDIDGIDVASKIKDLNMPVIYLTAHSEEPIIERAKFTEPYGYIIKPYNSIELKYAIELAIYKNQMEKELKESEDKYRSIVENVLDSYFRGDTKGYIIMASPSAARMFRYDSPEEMIGIPVSSLYKSPEDRQKVLEELKKHGKVKNMECEGLRNDGTSFWVSMNAQYHYDKQGKIKGTEAFVRDITDLKQTQERVLQSEKNYRELVDTSLVGVFKTNLKGHILFANQAMADIADLQSIEDLKSKNIGQFYKNPADRDEIITKLKKEGMIHQYELDMVSATGKTVNVSINAHLTNKTVSVIIIDITDKKQAYKKIKERESVFRNLIENMKDVIIRYDLDIRCQYVSPNIEDILGRKPEEFIGKTHLEAGFTPEMADFFDKKINKVINTKKPLDISFSNPSSHGLNYFESRIYPEIDLKGDIKSVVTVTHDITDSTKAFKALRKSETDLLKAQKLGHLGSWEWNIQKNTLKWSKELYNIFEVDKDYEFTFESIENMIHPEDKKKNLKIVNDILKRDDDVEYEFRIIINGEIRHIHQIINVVNRDENGNAKKAFGIMQDITKQRQAENDLKESEEFLGKIVENIPNTIFIKNAEQLNFEMINKAAEDLFGYPREELLGKTDYDIFPKDQADFFTKKDREVLENKKLLDIPEETIETKNIGQRILHTKKIPIFNKDGNPQYLLGISEDITELKQAENALKESETSYRELVDNSLVGVFKINLNGDILFVNDAITNMFHYDNIDDLKGNNIITLFKKREDRLQFIHKLEEEGHITDYNLETVDKNGQIVNLLISARLKDDILSGMFMDITKLKRSEKALIESEGLLRGLFDNMPSGMSVYQVQNDGSKGSDYIIKDINHASQKIEGMKREDVIGKNVNVIRPNVDEYGLIPIFKKVWDTGKPIYYPSKIYKDEKYENWYENYVFKTPTGEVVALYNDVTEQEKAKEKIQKSLEEKEILLKEVHHRVRNNLQIIASLLHLQERNEDDKKTVDIFKETEGRIKSMASIHEKLYESPTFNKINLMQYVKKLVYDILYTYGIPAGTIKTKLNIEDININIETAVPVGLIMNELVTNSVKYAFPQSKGTITIKLTTIKETLELTIADDGMGLPKNIDIKNPETLGLQLVNNLVEQIDGDIKIDRNNGIKYKISFKELKYKERI